MLLKGKEGWKQEGTTLIPYYPNQSSKTIFNRTWEFGSKIYLEDETFTFYASLLFENLHIYLYHLYNEEFFQTYWDIIDI